MAKKRIKKKLVKKNKNKADKIDNSNNNKNASKEKCKEEINNNIKEEKEEEEEKEKGEGDGCIICLTNYDNKYHIMKKLKCNHTLCESRFNKWYKIKESCPICRKKLFNNPSEHPDFYSTVKDLYLHHDYYFSKDY